MGNCTDLISFSSRDVDQIHDMMDDIAEQQNIATEISDAISNPVAFRTFSDDVCAALSSLTEPFFLFAAQDVDEDELERELEELEQEQLDKELLDVGPATGLPDVPTEDLPERAKEKKKG